MCYQSMWVGTRLFLWHQSIFVLRPDKASRKQMATKSDGNWTNLADFYLVIFMPDLIPKFGNVNDYFDISTQK